MGSWNIENLKLLITENVFNFSFIMLTANSEMYTCKHMIVCVRTYIDYREYTLVNVYKLVTNVISN